MSAAKKNLTLSVDAEVLATARRVAALSNTTVNALVREFLAQIASKDSHTKTARGELRKLSDTSTARLGEMSWNREDLYIHESLSMSPSVPRLDVPTPAPPSPDDPPCRRR